MSIILIAPPPHLNLIYFMRIREVEVSVQYKKIKLICSSETRTESNVNILGLNIKESMTKQ